MAVKAPGPPVKLIVQAGNLQVNVKWSPPLDNGGAPITSYTVTSNPGNKTATTPDGNTFAAMVTGLTNGTAYTFTVKATNSAGAGAASLPSPVSTPTATSPQSDLVQRLAQLAVTTAYDIPGPLRQELSSLAGQLAVHNGLAVP